MVQVRRILGPKSVGKKGIRNSLEMEAPKKLHEPIFDHNGNPFSPAQILALERAELPRIRVKRDAMILAERREQLIEMDALILLIGLSRDAVAFESLRLEFRSLSLRQLGLSPDEPRFCPHQLSLDCAIFLFGTRFRHDQPP